MGVPLYVFVHGDTLGLVVLARNDESIDALALRLARAAAPRVALTGKLHVLHRGKRLSGAQSLSEAGVQALDRVDLVPEPEGV
ncbi:MAG TPA: hypothetical protein VJN18_09660 [Polyangiaceae bacterium]|nr:hypothetical protein [Polyangiaceae bacterium]